MKKKTINMISQATSVKGQGVGSAYMEQVRLVKEGLSDKFEVMRTLFLSRILRISDTIGSCPSAVLFAKISAVFTPREQSVPNASST